MKEVTTVQLKERLELENPWWRSPHEISNLYKQMTPRPYIDLLMPLIEEREIKRALVLMGARRVGKTVILHHAIQHLIKSGTNPKSICYVSIDHPLFMGKWLDEIVKLFQEISGLTTEDECLFIFDEIQYLKDWERHLKSLVDSYPSFKFVVSGSAAAALKLKSTESGAGRFTDFVLPPLTFYEYTRLLGYDGIIDTAKLDQDDLKELNKMFLDYINYGGYPELALSEHMQKDPRRFISSDIIDKVLQRDLPSLYGISDIRELSQLFSMLAFNSGQEVGLDGLSKLSGVAKNTIKKYIEYLEAAFLIKVVHRIDQNARRFKREHTFKVYLTNPSMRAAMFAPVSSESDDVGAMVETAVFAQHFHWLGELHYARWHNGEIDLVQLDNSGHPFHAVEVKWSDRYLKKIGELSHALDFCRQNKMNKLTITTISITAEKENGTIKMSFTPASVHSYLVGGVAVEGRRAGLWP